MYQWEISMSRFSCNDHFNIKTGSSFELPAKLGQVSCCPSEGHGSTVDLFRWGGEKASFALGEPEISHGLSHLQGHRAGIENFHPKFPLNFFRIAGHSGTP